MTSMICKEITNSCFLSERFRNCKCAQSRAFDIKVVLIQPLETAGVCVHKSVNCIRRSVCVVLRSFKQRSGRCRNSTVWCSYSPASLNGKSGVLSMTYSSPFVYTFLLVVMVINSCKHELNALTMLPCWRQCNAKTCIWFQDHLQSPTAHLSSTNSHLKLSISPFIRCVAYLVSVLCFLLCILLQFLTILIKRASGLSLGTFYQNDALSRYFSHDFPCSPTLLLLLLPSHSLFCLVMSMPHRLKSLYLSWFMITKW
jgi:hypothetical protein